VGGIPVLASEFRVAELLTPVRWEAACRAPLVGLCTLAFLTTCHGVARLARTALHLDAQVTELSPAVGTLRTATEATWPEDSLFGAQETAEALLLRPEWYFAPDQDGRVVRAVPVHHYARATVAALAVGEGALRLVADTLHADCAEVIPDHALLQKRCTHTYHFPPETIVRTRPLATSITAMLGAARLALAA
jgi:hypothetical protein